MSDKTDNLVLDGKAYQSRLLVGTGKYKDMDQTRAAIEASGAQIVTVALRRTNLGQKAGESNLLDYISRNASRCCRIRRGVLTPSPPCVPVVWAVNCWTALRW